jgi:hypothetical protein
VIRCRIMRVIRLVWRSVNQVACGDDPDDDCGWQSWRKSL